MPQVSAGLLTTHVLDTARGCPAAGMRIELFRIEGEARRPLRTAVTDTDGRTDPPVVPRGELVTGTFELVFHAGEYLDRWDGGGAHPRFLDLVPIRFGVSDPRQHYHVPLLLSPYSYATYRGS